MDNIINIIICLAILAAAVAFVAVCMSLSGKGGNVNGEIENEEIPEGEAFEEDFSDEEYVVVPARVMDMKCEGKGVGSEKHPSYHVFYNVTFLTDRGETVHYSVSKEVFDKIYVHMTGDLVTVNGNFFDFSKGEEI